MNDKSQDNAQVTDLDAVLTNNIEQKSGKWVVINLPHLKAGIKQLMRDMVSATADDKGNIVAGDLSQKIEEL